MDKLDNSPYWFYLPSGNVLPCRESEHIAYLFTRPAKKERKANISPPVIPAETTTPTPPAPQNFEPIFTPIPEPVKVPEPLSVDQQRSVFEWMLEEKRKVKPQNREEKKRINEEKALLKQFIRADSIPKI
nr:uncharacterized protein LOC104099090 isoform X2 [Nicotiana tomentosiformis]XP_033512810.1 uncharacterized protein LOC104099090 isoform X2 [Nicotiana tomentosiformis]